MPFDPTFKARMEEQSRVSSEVQERAVLSNLHGDGRVPDSRAAELVAHIEKKGDSANIRDELDEFTTEKIRKAAAGDGFVHPNNDDNKLGNGCRFPARRSDDRYARALNFTHWEFFKALIAGRIYLIGKRMNNPSDFDSIGGFGKSVSQQLEVKYRSYCETMRGIAELDRGDFQRRLAPIFELYAGYLMAASDENSGVKPYEPAWVTPWDKAEECGLPGMDVEGWHQILGVEYQYEDPKLKGAHVFGLLKYRIPTNYSLYRPTCLEAGSAPLHYPTHCGLAEGLPVQSGYTMDCRMGNPTAMLREWIHLQCPLRAEDVWALGRPHEPFPDLAPNLLGWRKSHFGRLTADYPSAKLPPAEFIP
ncbi:hypothetical protein HZ994_01435 [Akkermansiaceae bacterium]|nr:hypothetical protein HZ994_01435 [Akkermansiaceae bacterium]